MQMKFGLWIYFKGMNSNESGFIEEAYGGDCLLLEQQITAAQQLQLNWKLFKKPFLVLLMKQNHNHAALTFSFKSCWCKSVAYCNLR